MQLTPNINAHPTMSRVHQQQRKRRNEGNSCLQPVPVQLLYSDVHRLGGAVVAGDRDDTPVDAPEPALADQEGSAEPPGGGLQLRERERAEALRWAGGRRAGEVPAGVEFGPPWLESERGGGGRDAEGACPGEAGDPGSGVIEGAAGVGVGEMKALHGRGETLEQAKA